MGNKKILVSLTTLSNISAKSLGTSWELKIEEIRENKIEEIALFLTGLEKDKREKLFNSLASTSVKKIPHVHIRNDMEPAELNYLRDKYKVIAFNLHPTAEWPLLYDYGVHMKSIYIENEYTLASDDELAVFGGLCVDFSHWEAARLENNQEYCKEMGRLTSNYKIGCCHVSAIKNKPVPIILDQNKKEYDSHVLNTLAELDYIKKYSKHLPDIISIELENSIKEQLEAKKYLKKILSL